MLNAKNESKIRLLSDFDTTNIFGFKKKPKYFSYLTYVLLICVAVVIIVFILIALLEYTGEEEAMELDKVIRWGKKPKICKFFEFYANFRHFLDQNFL